MSGDIVLINPNLVFQRNDMFTTGIVYMPVSLAYFAAALRAKGHEPLVIDAFGENPNQWWPDKELIFRGLKPDEVAAKIPASAKTIILYAIHLNYHASLLRIAKTVKKTHPNAALVVMENTQAVTAYSLRQVQDSFYDAEVDYVLTGEPEIRGIRLAEALSAGKKADISLIDGVGFRQNGQTLYTPPAGMIDNLDSLPFPAWDLFPLDQYWSLHYSHGPLAAKKYLPILTSRGCPYPCKFCVIPETNTLKWRSKSAAKVVEEMEFLSGRYGVEEFHIEDVDPTIDDQRTRAICEELIAKKMNVRWKLCSGTKVESIRGPETIDLMARAGCTYISISPESGSPKVLKLINKPFNLAHAKTIIQRMSQKGIYSQACFVLGFPGEEPEDREMTRGLLVDLARLGLDEAAIFIITPVPGSAIFQEFKGYDHYSQLTFSPSWRGDYLELNRFRLRLYALFLINKAIFHPFKLLAQPFRFLRRRFQTKMEMVPYRALHTTAMRMGITGRRVESLS